MSRIRNTSRLNHIIQNHLRHSRTHHILKNSILRRNLMSRQLSMTNRRIIRRQLHIQLMSMIPIVTNSINLKNQRQRRLIRNHTLNRHISRIIMSRRRLISLTTQMNIRRRLSRTSRLISTQHITRIHNQNRRTSTSTTRRRHHLLTSHSRISLNTLLLPLTRITRRLTRRIIIRTTNRTAVQKRSRMTSPLSLTTLSRMQVLRL